MPFSNFAQISGSVFRKTNLGKKTKRHRKTGWNTVPMEQTHLTAFYGDVAYSGPKISPGIGLLK
jgi:hypothetical protein